LTGLDPKLSADSDDEVDPRWLRSRTRLLDAAVELLRTRGIEAVTIDAVTKASKVARTTLYRHFGCSSDLRAATLERLLPPVTPPPSTGSLRDRLVELVCRQATLYKEAPLHPTTLAWIALQSTDSGADDAHDWQQCNSALQARLLTPPSGISIVTSSQIRWDRRTSSAPQPRYRYPCEMPNTSAVICETPSAGRLDCDSGVARIGVSLLVRRCYRR
jgi:Bacterial regulatory proteins, tetR family